MPLMKICPACRSEFEGGEIFCPNDGARLQTPSQMASPGGEHGDALVGQILDDRYRILRRIGEGGMGIVYEAEHAIIEKRVALKVLRDDYSSRSEVVQRFRQEAKSASRIGNEHIVDISDFGETPQNQIYFVMELLEGEDLANVLARERTLSVERAADILEQCLRALQAAHDKGIVHRDMKPENIFLTTREHRSDFVKIVDFGIAKMSDVETAGAPGRKLTKTGMIFGTPEYMSPEQAAGKELDHRVDLYALGVIFFEMLTGQTPFIGDSFMGILTQHMFEEPPRLRELNPSLSVDPAIEAFLDRALTKEPAERFQSCDEMAGALSAALHGEAFRSSTVVGYGEPVKYKPKPPRLLAVQAATLEFPLPEQPKKSSRIGLVAAGLGLVGAAGFGIWFMGARALEVDARDTDEPVASVPTTESSLAEQGTAPSTPEEAEAAVTPEEPAPSNASVTVRVNTRPSGARVWVVGRGDVCQETPCAFETPAGERITVRARRGRAEGEIEFLPEPFEDEEPREITIALRAPRSDSSPRGESEPPGHGDLKIPDVFRRTR